MRREVEILESLAGHPNVINVVDSFEDEKVRAAVRCSNV